MMKKDLNIIVTIRNLKEEAKDDDAESGVSVKDGFFVSTYRFMNP